jgi:predicted nuclease of predicted toxin-antitoxin system
VKLLLDENLSPEHAMKLRSDGYDARSVVDVGLSGASDQEVLQFAIENGCVLLTLDADFVDVMQFSPVGTPGIVRMKIRRPTEARIGEMLLRVLLFLQNVDLRGRLAVVDERKIRVRG